VVKQLSYALRDLCGAVNKNIFVPLYFSPVLCFWIRERMIT